MIKVESNIQGLLLIGILIYMFLSPSVANLININSIGSVSMAFFLIPITKYLLVSPNKIFKPIYTYEFYILFLGTIICLIKFSIGDLPLIRTAVFYFIVPMVLSIILSKQSFKFKITLRNLIILFFFAECTLAFYEKLTISHIFPYEPDIIVDIVLNNDGFRSSAFLGHPLANALIVSTIMGFAILSNLNIMIKGVIYFYGMGAILCFNARGAILIWIILSVFLFIDIFRNKKYGKLTSLGIFVSIILCLGSLYYSISEYGLGDRLTSEKIFDGSAKTRIDVVNSFKYVKNTDLIFGNSSLYLYVTDKLGAAGVENSFIVLILNYGIPLFIIIIILYYLWLINYLRHLIIIEKLLVLLSFIAVGSTNNALAGATPWMFFVFCMHSFIPNSMIIQTKKIIYDSNLQTK